MMTDTSTPALASLPPYSGAFEGVLAQDDNPLSDVVEVTLEAREAAVEISDGRVIKMWTYNGVVPGPRIEANVGDTVRVHFKNSLAEPTTIHWHGLRIPAAMDGVVRMMNPVEPGATFTYEFKVPDAGTFWYHPHVHADEQVGRGLIGAIVVHGTIEPSATSDHVVVLHDVLLGNDGQIAASNPMQTMMGREGNVVLVNGHVLPTAEVATGGLHRFRFVNAAAARYFKLAAPGHDLLLVGQDGALLEHARAVQELLLVPGQRADILVRASNGVGDKLLFQSLPYDRGHAMMMRGSSVASERNIDLFSARQVERHGDANLTAPDVLGAIGDLPAPSVRRELKLEESMDMMSSGSRGMMDMTSFSINGESYPDVTTLRAKLDDVEEWTIKNTTEMDHPFHLHGVRFQVVSIEGAAPTFRAWQDTFNVKAKQTSVLRVKLDNPGTWMFHCHILAHEEHGMAGEVEVAR